MEAAIAAAIGQGGGEGTVADLMSNPAIMAALQSHLGGLAGTSSGLLEELPPAVRRRIKSLKVLAFENAKLDAEMKKEMLVVEAKFDALRKPLFAKRSTIIAGSYEPTDEECDWEDEEDEDEEEAPVEEEGAEAVAGVPNFWLTVFQNCQPIADTIEEQDVEILKHLENVTIETDEGGNYLVTFTFAENEFFAGTVMTKKYNVSIDMDPAHPDCHYDGPEYKQGEGCVVAWNLNMNPCVKITEKKQRKKTGAGKGQVRTVKKTEAVPSFFNFFTPPTMPDSADPDELSEELQEELFRDFELGDVLKDRVIPHAVLWYTGEAMGSDDEMDEDDEDEDGMGEDDDEEEEDPDYAPPPEGEKPAECKNQ
jgi:nucleosome assembly protein 1-like 1